MNQKIYRNHQLYSSQNFHSGSQYRCFFPFYRNTIHSRFRIQSLIVIIYVVQRPDSEAQVRSGNSPRLRNSESREIKPSPVAGGQP